MVTTAASSQLLLKLEYIMNSLLWQHFIFQLLINQSPFYSFPFLLFFKFVIFDLKSRFLYSFMRSKEKGKILSLRSALSLT
jgi:hypothetical protein